MQKQILLSGMLLVSASLVAQNEIEKGKLSAAIENQDFEKVQKTLKEVGELEPADKKSFLKGANDIVAEKREGVSLSKSKWDLAKFIGGSFAAVAGLPMAAAGVWLGRYFQSGRTDMDSAFRHSAPQWLNDRDRAARECYTAGVIYGILGVAGVYFAVKGYYCDTAFGKVTQARKIANLIKKAPVKGGAQPEPVEAEAVA